MNPRKCFIKTPRKLEVLEFVRATRNPDTQLPIVEGYTIDNYLVIKHSLYAIIGTFTAMTNIQKGI
jgi:hypothetical protein